MQLFFFECNNRIKSCFVTAYHQGMHIWLQSFKRDSLNHKMPSRFCPRFLCVMANTKLSKDIYSFIMILYPGSQPGNLGV